MVKFYIDTRGDNSSKRKLIADFNRAYADNDSDVLAEMFDEDVTWDFGGGNLYVGREEVMKIFYQGVSDIVEMLVKDIILDGNECACYGEMTYSTGTRVRFCDIYSLTDSSTNPKIKRVISCPMARL